MVKIDKRPTLEDNIDILHRYSFVYRCKFNWSLYYSIYAVINQQNIFSQNLITSSKSRLARKNLSIPRLELLVAHTSANLAENVTTYLNKLSPRKIYARSDSTTSIG